MIPTMHVPVVTVKSTMMVDERVKEWTSAAGGDEYVTSHTRTGLYHKCMNISEAICRRPNT